MSTIGTLAVNVVANTKGLQTGLSKAQNDVQKFAATTNAGGISGMAGGLVDELVSAAPQIIGVAAAIGGVTVAVNEVFEAFSRLDDLGDTAASLGVSVPELQALSYAADQTGSSADAMQTGLGLLTRKLGEVRAGSASAADDFERLGLNAQELAQRGTAGAFADIAAKIAQIPNASDRAAAAVAIFGKKGLELVNVLSQGKDGIAALAEEADRSGLLLSDEAAGRAGEAADAIAALGTQLQALWNEIAVSVAPIVTGFVRALRECLKVAGDVWRALTFQRRESQNLAFATSQLTEAQKREAAALKERAGLAKQKAEADKKAADEAKARATELARQQEDLQKRGEALTRSLRTPAEIYQDSLREARQLLQANTIGMETFRREAQRAADDFRRATAASEEMQQAQGPGGVLVRGTTAAFSAVQEHVIRAQHEREQAAAAKATADNTARIAAQAGVIIEKLDRPPVVISKVTL